MSENASDPLGSAPKEGLPGLTPEELDVLRKVFSSPLDVPQEWKAWLVSWLEANPPVLPISQIIGYTDFTDQIAASRDAAIAAATAAQVTATVATVLSAQNTTSATYTDMTTAGPEITGLVDGQYIIFHGCSLVTSIANAESYQSISVNGAAASDNDAVTAGVTSRASVFTAVSVTLNAGGTSNSVKCVYRVDGGATLTAAKRKLIAAKYANL